MATRLCSELQAQGLLQVTRTLDTDVDIVLRLLGLSGVLVGLGEGVCENVSVLVEVCAAAEAWGRSDVKIASLRELRLASQLATLRKPLLQSLVIERHTEGFKIFDGHKLECAW